MSLLPQPGTRRRHRASTYEGSVQMTLGRSINGGSLLHPSTAQGQGHARTLSEPASPPPPPPAQQFISKLPPAVASVPPGDVRGYVHSKRVTHYQIGSTLGEGSFAKVKEGFHVLVGEKVAVKVIDKKKAMQDPYVAKHFRREAKLLQMLHHPNILQLLEVVETDNSYYLITELCAGGDLMKHIYKMMRLEEKETRKFMRQIVSAVDHLHKAGIIHRDLKVENLLLDGNGNIKIIDFGLSNEEYVVEESGRVHCSTQCGSPAYAAPELLGHKSYGPEVDIWSIGVNMYAMLTGCLPYTVEPFNITALHAKMLENRMNPIPLSLSDRCKDLLQRLLTSDPAQRIKMAAVMEHPWMTDDGSPGLRPHPYPNKLSVNDVNEDIVEHMAYVLKLKDSEREVTSELLTDRACAISAVYHLLSARLDRYNKQKPNIKLRKRSKQLLPHNHMISQDNDDTHSIVSCPPRSQDNKLQFRKPAREAKSKSMSVEVTDNHGNPPPENSLIQQRRRTLPSELMKDDIDKLHHRSNLPPLQRNKHGTLPRPSRNRPDITLHTSRGHEATEPSRPSTHLNPVRPPPTRPLPSSSSHPKDLLELRQDLGRHMGMAWHSQPSSRAGSLAGSRTHSRQPSASSKHTSQSSITQRHSGSECDSDIEFYEVESSHAVHTSPSKHGHGPPHSQKKTMFSSDGANHTTDVHFPSLAPQSGGSRDTRHRSSSHGSRETYHGKQYRRNGYVSPSKMFEFRTDMSVSTVVSELQRVVGSLNISWTEQKGNSMCLKYQSVRFQVHVDKDSHGTCHLDFQWLSGGDQGRYEDLCTQIFHTISV